MTQFIIDAYMRDAPLLQSAVDKIAPDRFDVSKVNDATYQFEIKDRQSGRYTKVHAEKWRDLDLSMTIKALLNP